MTVLVVPSRPRPLTDALKQVYRSGATYEQLSRGSRSARSTSWFHKLMTHRDPWVVSPPTRSALPGLANLVGKSIGDLEAMVALEWYGIEPVLPAHLRAVAEILEGLDVDDSALVSILVARLATPGAQTTPQRSA